MQQWCRWLLENHACSICTWNQLGQIMKSLCYHRNNDQHSLYFSARGLPTMNFEGIKGSPVSHVHWLTLLTKHSPVGYSLLCCQAWLLAEVAPHHPGLTGALDYLIANRFQHLFSPPSSRSDPHSPFWSKHCSCISVLLTSPQGIPLCSLPLEINFIFPAKGARICLRFSTMCRVPRIPHFTGSQGVGCKVLILLVFSDGLLLTILDPK